MTFNCSKDPTTFLFLTIFRTLLLVDFQQDLPLPPSKIIALIRSSVTTNFFFLQRCMTTRTLAAVWGVPPHQFLNQYLEYFESNTLPQV